MTKILTEQVRSREQSMSSLDPANENRGKEEGKEQRDGDRKTFSRNAFSPKEIFEDPPLQHDQGSDHDADGDGYDATKFEVSDTDSGALGGAGRGTGRCGGSGCLGRGDDAGRACRRNGAAGCGARGLVRPELRGGVRRARRRSGDRSGVWHGDNYRGLDVSRSNARRVGVDADGDLVIREAGLEDTGSVGGGSVVLAADLVEDVVAVTQLLGRRERGVARLETEHIGSHEAVPLYNLNVRVVPIPKVGEDEGAQRVTTTIGAVGIELSSLVGGVLIDVSLVDQTSHLDVCGGDKELDGGDGSGGHYARAMRGQGAPRDGGRLSVTNFRVGGGRAPQAEVLNGVDDRGLALRLLVLRRRIANIVSGLGTTAGGIGVDLIR